MSENCTHDCSSCGENCPSRKSPQSFLVAPLPGTKIKKVIAVESGKGGVGKSMVTSMMAVALRREGLKVGILDADITGPSIPQAFGIHEKAMGDGENIFPAVTRTDIKMMSVNLLLERETDPVIWRGPVIAGMVKQFWSEVLWEELDVLLVDMPPGTGDVPLTVFQSLPVDGVIVVTSPQELVGMIVEKAVHMTTTMKIPVVGIVENMSYFLCPNCGEKHFPYGESRIEETAKSLGIDTICRLPIRSDLAKLADTGHIEEAYEPALDEMVKKLKSLS